MPGTLVTFHAHPDDEALLTAGTMAKAVSEGHRVVLVVATLGEVGEVSTTFLDGGEDLGERRSRELERSAALLGVHRLEVLGYRDSGLESSAAEGFSTIAVDAAAEKLATILGDERADAVTIYDPNGGYGHPDHVQVHRVGKRAAELAGTPKVLEATFDRDLLLAARDLLPASGIELPPGFEPPDVSTWFVPHTEITHEIDVTGFLDQKRASMEAHASQTTASTDTIRNLQLFLSLPDDLFAMAFGTEWYIDRDLDPAIKERELFARSVATDEAT
jgi:LmbE family N-acetylglucosaminyl deacetylase